MLPPPTNATERYREVKKRLFQRETGKDDTGVNTKQPLPTGRQRGTERREASERAEVSRRH